MSNSQQGWFPGTDAQASPSGQQGQGRWLLVYHRQQHLPSCWHGQFVKNYEDCCALGAVWPTTGQMSQCSSRTRNTELQFIVKGNPKTPQYRPALRPRVRGKLRLRYFEAILQVNTYTMSKRAGSCLQINAFILSLKHSPALISQFSSLIS